MLIPSEKHVKMEQEKQASDTAAMIQVELIQAEVRERQLQMQLYKMKNDVSQLQTAQPTVSLAEGIAQLETGKKLTQHDSMFDDFSVCGLIMRSSLHEAALRIASRLCV